MVTLTREQVREVDRLAIEELGIPGVVLMENAGRNATDIIQRYMQQRGAELESALILCGGGNNGGDGYVIARHLYNRGVHVTILTTKSVDQLKGDALINARICRNMNLPIHPATGRGVLEHAGANLPTLIIDALLGTGFQGELRPDMLELIQAVNEWREANDSNLPRVVAAIDLPSGLDCNTGSPPTSRQGVLQHAIRADLTITFVAAKQGFTQPAAKPYIGLLEVADIGAPPELVQRVREASSDSI